MNVVHLRALTVTLIAAHVACSKTPAVEGPVVASSGSAKEVASSVALASANASASSAVAPATPAASVASVNGLALPPAVARGPIKVVGFPKSVFTGMNDPAKRAGFSADGADFGYCSDMNASDEPRITCVSIGRDGKTTTQTTNDAKAPAAKKPTS